MISSRLPRWPDRDAAGLGATFPLTVRHDERTARDDGKIAFVLDGGQTDWRGGMAVWPDESVDKPNATPSWWFNVLVVVFFAVNAIVWWVGLATLAYFAMNAGASLP